MKNEAKYRSILNCVCALLFHFACIATSSFFRSFSHFRHNQIITFLKFSPNLVIPFYSLPDSFCHTLYIKHYTRKRGYTKEKETRLRAHHTAFLRFVKYNVPKKTCEFLTLSLSVKFNLPAPHYFMHQRR
jgi:hypothetical protein